MAGRLMFCTTCFEGKYSVREYTVNENEYIFTLVDAHSSVLRLTVSKHVYNDIVTELVIIGSLNNVMLHTGMLKHYIAKMLPLMHVDAADDNTANLVYETFKVPSMNFPDTNYISFMD